jgi:cbb3-type cytochrome oxidase subunit 3
MSYGYRPPDQGPHEGSWGEAWAIMRVVFGLLLPLLGVLFGVLGLVIATLMLFFRSPPLALIPLAILALIVWWVVRREKRTNEDEERRVLGR